MRKLIQPNEILNPGDPGDDTLRRYRFQASYAAVLSLNMLQTDSRIAELYCELHEDILLKLTNGKFQGVQVKTKAPHLGVFDIDDDEILKCFKRFVALDLNFPNCFEGFSITTNVSFSRQKQRCLSSFCQLAKEGKAVQLLTARTTSKRWITDLAKKNSCTPELIISILSRLRLRENFSTLEDISHKVYNELLQVQSIISQTTRTVTKICEKLIAKHVDASSLAFESPLEGCFVLSQTPSQDLAKSIIKGKKITKELVEKIITDGISDPIKLFIKDSKGLAALPTGEDILELKMDTGGISIENIQLTKDNKFSFENLTASWIYKMDSEEASKRYDQVKLIVQNECQAAYDQENQTTDPYGTKMLVDVRSRLQKRFDKDPTAFFDCDYEHLLGVVGSLTEECKVWWSPKFDLKAK